MEKINNLKIGVISDGMYGERAFENIQKVFQTIWILVPFYESNVFLDDDINFEIPECDLYISYARHSDVILEIAALKKPLILGVLPGYGLYRQAFDLNQKTIYAPTMCSLEDPLGIPEIESFLAYFGRPIYESLFNEANCFDKIIVKRSSLCGSSRAGAKFLEKKRLTVKNLQEFALNICHECRAPRFGRTCDKEVAGIIHLISIFESISSEELERMDNEVLEYYKGIRKEYINRKEKSELD